MPGSVTPGAVVPGSVGGARVSCRPGIDGRCRVGRRGRTGIDGRGGGRRRDRRGLADKHDAVARLIVAARLERGRNELAVAGVDVAVRLDLVAGVGGLLDLALAGGELVGLNDLLRERDGFEHVGLDLHVGVVDLRARSVTLRKSLPPLV